MFKQPDYFEICAALRFGTVIEIQDTNSWVYKGTVQKIEDGSGNRFKLRKSFVITMDTIEDGTRRVFVEIN